MIVPEKITGFELGIYAVAAIMAVAVLTMNQWIPLVIGLPR